MPVMMTYKKSTPLVCDLYKLQPINLDATYRYLRHFKKTEHF